MNIEWQERQHRINRETLDALQNQVSLNKNLRGGIRTTCVGIILLAVSIMALDQVRRRDIAELRALIAVQHAEIQALQEKP